MGRRMDEKRLPEVLPGIDITDFLRRVRGNAESAIRFLNLFIGKYTGAVAKIRDDLEKNELEAARHFTHGLKGAAGNIAANNLYVAASELEIAIKFETRDEFDQLLDNFERAFDEVCASAEKAVRGSK